MCTLKCGGKSRLVFKEHKNNVSLKALTYEVFTINLAYVLSIRKKNGRKLKVA